MQTVLTPIQKLDYIKEFIEIVRYSFIEVGDSVLRLKEITNPTDATVKRCILRARSAQFNSKHLHTRILLLKRESPVDDWLPTDLQESIETLQEAYATLCTYSLQDKGWMISPSPCVAYQALERDIDVILANLEKAYNQVVRKASNGV